MGSLATIHVGKKQLGLDEDTYRAMLARVTGKSSLRDMSEGERAAVMREMRRCGFKPVSARGGRREADDREDKKDNKGAFKQNLKRGKKPRSSLYKKLQALWIAGYNLGVVRDRTDAGLDGFIARKCGGSEVQAVEALKGWLARETPVDWGAKHYTSDEERVAAAQWLLLCELSSDNIHSLSASASPTASCYRPGGFMAAIQSIVGRSRVEMRGQDWHEVMNELGSRLRHLQAIVKTRGVEERSSDRE